MAYLRNTLENINLTFIIDPLNTNVLIDNPVLSRTGNTIAKAWRYYTIESSDGEDFEKMYFTPSLPKDKKFYKEFNFEYLYKNLNKLYFERDMEENILEEKNNFFEYIENRLLNFSTDLQISNELTIIIEKIKNSIGSLKNLKSNEIQQIVIDLYIQSYKETINDLNDKYRRYILQEHPDTSLEKIIIKEKLNKFMILEAKLIEQGYMRKSGIRLYWNNKRGYLVRLVNFCRLLKANEYTHVEFKELIKYFEERYNINVGDQIKPSKFNGTLEQIRIDFHFLDF